MADLIPFWDHYKISTEAIQLSIGTRGNIVAGTTGELGRLGYAREAVQVLGFMVGGFFGYQSLSDVDACKTCKRYAKETTLLENVRAEVYDGVFANSGVSLPGFIDQLRVAVTRRGVGDNRSSETVRPGRSSLDEELAANLRSAVQRARATVTAKK